MTTTSSPLPSVKCAISGPLAALVFAALDQIIVRKEFGRNMRMSRRELRREVRDREGEPRLKQKRKQLHAGRMRRGDHSARR